MEGRRLPDHCKRNIPAFQPAILLAIILCSCSSEDRQWRAATEANTIASYQEFIDSNPDSTWLAAAEEKLNGLYDWAPFAHIERAVSGKSRRSDITRLFGEPTEVTRSFGGMVRMPDGHFQAFGNHLLIRYDQRGLEFVVNRDEADQPDPVINSIQAKPPYQGTAPKGLRLGLRKTNVDAVFSKSFVREAKLSKENLDYWLLRKDVAVTNGPIIFMILSYENDVLSAIQMLRYTRIKGE